MVSTRRTRTKQNNTNTIASENVSHCVNSNNERIVQKGNEASSGAMSGYEQFRDQRIKENKERMQKLGLLDLSLKLKAQLGRPKKTPGIVSSEKKPHTPLPVSASPRRSSRLKIMDPINYMEIRPTRKETSMDVEIQLREGSQPEIYTEEDENLLGDHKTTWTLNVDGCGKDGRRVYDPEMGETCHQCRQKTLGLHTHCSKCNLVQGQFCGDCLFMRYGENVIEVNQNPSWICPVCRGICNCSLCRHAKGWAPTGNLYRKVISLGFKSVAHYLIQTRRAQTHSEDSGAESLVSEEGELSSADEGSRPVTCNESVNADEHRLSNIIEVPILNECPNPHPDGYEEEEKQVNSSDGSSDGYEDADGDNTVNNDNKLKERNETLAVQEVGDSKI
ncbi:PREDICTED: cell division cycle-associated protein 7-like [Populus euphratica]|uniref:Cell division cycle-associated protein 7-like n=1 Tax=Populus euphratica TaxID=75702 RepID=A0AAJ6SVE1_POPEU|nr:PREDICTED: cell division cycle-associated protein 7-like [Populus euphratica]